MSLLLASMLLFASAALYSYYEIFNIGKIKTGPEDPLEAWSEASYIIWKYNSTHYAARNMSTLLVEFGPSTNASEILQNTIDNGDTIFIKSGMYILSNILTVDSYTTIEGEGFQTILKLQDNMPDTASSRGVIENENWKVAGVSNVIIRNLQIDGNKAGQTIIDGYVGIQFSGKNLGGDDCENIIIENVKIVNSLDGGIYSGDTNAMFIRNIFIDNWGTATTSYGQHAFYFTRLHNSHLSSIYITNGLDSPNNIPSTGLNMKLCQNVTVNQIVVKSVSGSGISMGDAGQNKTNKNIKISNVAIHDVGWYGIWLVIGDIDYNNQISFSNFIIENSSLAGVYVQESKYVQFVNGHANFNGRNGYHVTTNAHNVSFTNCYANANGQNVSNTYSGFFLASEHITIMNSYAYDTQASRTQKYGIEEHATASDYNVIIGVTAHGYTSDNGIIINGANTKVNLCWNGTNWIP